MRVAQARYYFNLFLGISFIFVIVNSIIFYCNGEKLLLLLANDRDINIIGKELMGYLTLNIVLEFFKGYSRQVISALSLQFYLMPILFVSNYLVGFILQYYLAFYYEMELEGVWIAKLISETLIIVSSYLLIIKSDWEFIAIEARDR